MNVNRRILLGMNIFVTSKNTQVDKMTKNLCFKRDRVSQVNSPSMKAFED